MKVLVTGTNGLLGRKLVQALCQRAGVQVVATSRGEDRAPDRTGYRYAAMDCTVQEEVHELIAAHKPDVIIHTAAMTNVDACELEPTACQLQNVDAVAHVAMAANAAGAHLIHLSTDFIFDGSAGPYAEDDIPAPLSVYGQSKLDAEQIVREAGLARWSIVRTIIVYGFAPGLSRSNVVLWAKSALEKGAAISVVDDQWRMPTLAEDLAEACIRIAERRLSGVYHVSGPDGMSILELVHRVAGFFQLDRSSVRAVSSASLGQPAKRPPRTGFLLHKAQRDFAYAPRSFEQGLAVLAEQIEQAR
jgi:dTDP-4-dehydrorhamnose reductase